MGFFSSLFCGIFNKNYLIKDTCNTMLNNYKIATNREYRGKDALKACLNMRYSVIQAIPESKYNSILEESNDLGSLVYLCLREENPILVGRKPFEVMDHIINFFEINAPEHAQGLKKFKETFFKVIHAINSSDGEALLKVLDDCEHRRIPLSTLMLVLLNNTANSLRK